MQKHPLIVSFFAVLVLLGISMGCKKNSSSTTSTNSTVTLITQAAWKYDTSGIDLNSDGKVDLSDTLVAPCDKDDLFTFSKDSTGTIDEGPTKCNVADAQTDPMTWYLTSNNTVLNVSSTGLLNGSLNIFSLTSSNMVLYKDTTISSISFRYLIALKH
jgi:hypothetical protein